MHHGLAKGALFLLVGVMLVSHARWQRTLCLVLAAIVAASVAGAPLTGGALAKAAVKQGLAEWALFALQPSVPSPRASFLAVVPCPPCVRVNPSGEGRRGRGGRLAGSRCPAILGALALAAPWALWQDWTGLAHGTREAGKPARRARTGGRRLG